MAGDPQGRFGQAIRDHSRVELRGAPHRHRREGEHDGHVLAGQPPDGVDHPADVLDILRDRRGAHGHSRQGLGGGPGPQLHEHEPSLGIEEVGGDAERQDDHLAGGESRPEPFANGRPEGRVHRPGRVVHRPVFEPSEQTPVRVGAVDLLTDLFGMGGVALRTQAVRQVLGEARAQSQEHRLGTDERRPGAVAEQILPDQESRVLEGRALHRPRPRTRRRRPRGRRASERGQQSEQASRGVLGGIQRQRLPERRFRLRGAAQVQQGFAQAQMRLTKLGALRDRPPRHHLGLRPLAKAPTVLQRLDMGGAPLLWRESAVRLRKRRLVEGHGDVDSALPARLLRSLIGVHRWNRDVVHIASNSGASARPRVAHHGSCHKRYRPPGCTPWSE